MTASASATPPAGPHTGSTATIELHAPVAVIQGVIGSVMMFLGSLGTGWIANGSPMVRHPLIIELRVNVWGVYACTALLTLGGSPAATPNPATGSAPGSTMRRNSCRPFMP